MSTRAKSPRRGTGTQVSLRPADPFELVRWLARSQSDPRKAVAELVQNSLDAGARRVVIERRRTRGEMRLSVRDDGEGVLPALDREAAMRHLATNVGHSQKLGLDPAERHRRVIAGKYGVGLLGFWAIGRFLELRSRVGGSALVALLLEEDSPRAQITTLPLATDATGTYTEVVVRQVHETAQKALVGRRLSDYLAAELRGQLLARDVVLEVHDHAARGLAQKKFEVRPKKFTGEPLALPSELATPGFAPVRIELYLARGAERPAVQVACAGTLVADDLGSLDALGLAVDPWVGRELVGILDFPSFHVPPGTRRGVAPDAAARAFVEALERLEPLVRAELARFERDRQARVDRDVVRELRRALRGFASRLPHYELPAVESRGGAAPDASGDASGGEPLDGGATSTTVPDTWLFPPGALAEVRIAPSEVRLAPGTERRVRAIAADADGRPLRDATFTWHLDGGGTDLAVHPAGPRPAVSARADADVGREAVLVVVAHAEGATATATAQVHVAVADDRDLGALGVPEPQLVSDADGRWRSRFVGDRWEVNDAHADYRALHDSDRARLRYLLGLLAKEIVLRTSGRADVAELLESVVEILAHAERNLVDARPGRVRPTPRDDSG